MGVLVEVGIKVRPSSTAAFHQEIAVQHLLWRNIFGLFSILELETGVDSLYEAYSVARATRSLVSNIIQEVITGNVSKVVVHW